VRSTNAIENLNGLVGHFVHNVRRWRNGRMLVRWIAAGLQETGRSFRRLRGHRDLAALIRALDRPAMDTRRRSRRNCHPSRRSAAFNSERDIPLDRERSAITL